MLRGHYGYYGKPHNYPTLNGFYREVQRIWMGCLRLRSQTNRRTGWSEFKTLTGRFLLPVHPSLALGHRRGYYASHPREEPSARKPRARIRDGEAEWSSYSTTTV